MSKKKGVTETTETTKRSIKESADIIFVYWNGKKIVKHRVLTERIRRKISGQLRDYTVPEICKAIRNYSKIVHGDEYYWTYKWTLFDFLQRGLEKFMDEADPFNNFKASYPVSKGVKVVANKEYTSRFEQWKKASSEKRKKLEQEWGGV